ncbi:hypothetical protein N7I30_19935 [Aurantimonas litoralis]|nr:hypothetical protein [Aurantimonas litoralis]
MAKPFDGQYYEVVGERSFSERLLVKAREAMYRDFIDRVQPTESTSIVDIGVSDVQTNGAN